MLVVALATMLLSITVAGCESAAPAQQQTSFAEVPLKLPAVGPPAPASGALLGAWVMPQTYTPEGQVAAVRDFEARIGRPLAFVHVFRQWADPFPRPSDLSFVQHGDTLLLSWNGIDTRTIAAGSQDDVIRRMAVAVKSLGAPIWIRWRWEMNRPNLRSLVWSPEDYVAAWRHIRAIFAAEHVTNAAWVWCPLASKWESDDGAAYYPGDDQVDWLCTDVYPADGQSFADVAAPFLNWAVARPQPVMIGEFGAPDVPGIDRAGWLTAAFAYIRSQPRIKALAYFEGSAGENSPDGFLLEPGTAAFDAFRGAAATPYFRAGLDGADVDSTKSGSAP